MSCKPPMGSSGIKAGMDRKSFGTSQIFFWKREAKNGQKMAIFKGCWHFHPNIWQRKSTAVVLDALFVLHPSDPRWFSPHPLRPPTSWGFLKKFVDFDENGYIKLLNRIGGCRRFHGYRGTIVPSTTFAATTTKCMCSCFVVV